MSKILKKYLAVAVFCIFSLAAFVATASTLSPVMSVESPDKVYCGKNFTVNITVDPMANEIFSAEYVLNFDPEILSALSQTNGTFLSGDGTGTIVYPNNIDNAIGKTEYGETRADNPSEVGGVTNPGVLAMLTFVIEKPGVSFLNLSRVMLIKYDRTNDSLGKISALTVNGIVEVEVPAFDTGPGSYPSIFGTHNGTITPNQTITVQKLCTYPCPGTGGHTEYAKIWNNSGFNATATWNGYNGDKHSIFFDKTFSLVANNTYNYTIRTGSYPQIIHANEEVYIATGGKITCEKFTDANGFVHENWIPAITLEVTK